jgi:uncharacterized membrane protein
VRSRNTARRSIYLLKVVVGHGVGVCELFWWGMRRSDAVAAVAGGARLLGWYSFVFSGTHVLDQEI